MRRAWWTALLVGAAACAHASAPKPGIARRPLLPAASMAQPSRASPTPLKASFSLLEVGRDFQLQASSQVTASGSELSTPGFVAGGWASVQLPSTVLAGLVAAGRYPDPFVKNNLDQIPASAFNEPYWFRGELQVPADFAAHATWLRLNGVNYRADVWLNGRQITSANECAGAFAAHEWNVSSLVRPGAANALAIRVYPPDPKKDLAIWWQDWNPAPPDQNMGVWQPIWLERSGPVRLTGSRVLAQLEPSLDKAELTIKAELSNVTTLPARVELRARLDGRTIAERFDLAPGEARMVTLAPKQHPELVFTSPRLWWPRGLGEPNLYELELAAEVDGATSSQEHVTFGIRRVTFDLDQAGHRLFKVNGRPFFVRGGGWASDLLLRSSPQRLEDELRLVRDLGLNTLRLEGKLEPDAFYDLADRYGIAVIPGWMCCDRWQESANWSADERRIARESTATQARRLRNHPSVLSFMIGSDEAPAPEVERELVAELEQADWARPISAAASERTTPLLGATGVKMSGPYDWVSPAYWYEDREHGGAFGFNTETGPGPALPELETLRIWLTREELDRLWSAPHATQFHAGRKEFYDLSLFDDALAQRYGKPRDLEDFVRKAQLMSYEAERALFESYSGRRFAATGVVHWLVNNAWPSLIWHLYDHDLGTAAAYYAAKKANEPLHAQYGYDGSVSVVNETSTATDVTVTTQVLDPSGVVRFEHNANVTAAPDAATAVTTLPELPKLPRTYFVRLRSSRGGVLLSDNWYWLSTRAEKSRYDRSDFFHAPVAQFADFRGLSQLAPAGVTVSARAGDAGQVSVTLDNSSANLAFFVRVVLLDQQGRAVPAVLWKDNYVSLTAGDRRELNASLAPGRSVPDGAVLHVEGVNVPAQDLPLAREIAR